MRILTVRQPWASAIASGHKTVENRSTNLAGNYRGAIAIHAAIREDTSARDHREIVRWARDYWGTTPAGLFVGARTKFGHIIGVVDLIDVHDGDEESLHTKAGNVIGTRACSPWADPDVHHLVLANPRPLAEPIPYKGALGLRNLDDETIAQILAQIGETDA